MSCFKPNLQLRELRLVGRNVEKPAEPATEKENKQSEAPHEDTASPVETAHEHIEEAENDADGLRRKVDASMERVKAVQGVESPEEREVLQQRIDKCNERHRRLVEKLPDDFLTKTFIGQYLASAYYGVHTRNGPFICASFDDYRRVLARGIKVLREDEDGKVFGYEGMDDTYTRKGVVFTMENRADGVRTYCPIESLEASVERDERVYTTEGIKENPEYQAIFNQKNRVRTVAGKHEDSRVDLDDPPDESLDLCADAKQFKQEFAELMAQVPDGAKDMVVLRLLKDADVGVDRDGKLLMIFSADRGPEFREMAPRLFEDIEGHIRQDEDGRYAVELAPGSLGKLTAHLRIVFLVDNKQDETLEELARDLDEVSTGKRVETPTAVKAKVEKLNGRLTTFVDGADQAAVEASPVKFASDMRFTADEAGRLSFTHTSFDAVLQYFEQVEDSDTFQSQHELFEGVRLKLDEGTFRSESLSLDRADQLVEQLGQEIAQSVRPDVTQIDEVGTEEEQADSGE